MATPSAARPTAYEPSAPVQTFIPTAVAVQDHVGHNVAAEGPADESGGRRFQEMFEGASRELAWEPPMTFGIINLVFSFFAVLVMDVGGAVLTFIVGSAATTSSVMYNPCGCCSPPQPERIKSIALLSMIASTVCFAGIVVSVVRLGETASWEGGLHYACCKTPNALPESSGCDDKYCLSAERGRFGCFASGRAEARCKQDGEYKHVVVTLDGDSERTAHMLLAGLGLVWYLASGLVAAPSAFFTRRESRAVF